MADWYEKQVGPLPLGIWLLAGAGGLGLAYLANKRLGSSAKTDNAPVDTGGFLSTTPGVSVGLPTAVPATTFPSSGGNSPTTYTDNLAWQRAAITDMISRGYDATLVTNAISHYLNSIALSSDEQAVISTVLAKVGPPPFPPTGVITPPSNNPPPTPAPVSIEWPRGSGEIVTFSVDGSGVLRQTSVRGTQTLLSDSPILSGNAPNSAVHLDVSSDGRLSVTTVGVNNNARYIYFVQGQGWFDAYGNRL